MTRQSIGNRLPESNDKVTILPPQEINNSSTFYPPVDLTENEFKPSRLEKLCFNDIAIDTTRNIDLLNVEEEKEKFILIQDWNFSYNSICASSSKSSTSENVISRLSQNTDKAPNTIVLIHEYDEIKIDESERNLMNSKTSFHISRNNKGTPKEVVDEYIIDVVDRSSENSTTQHRNTSFTTIMSKSDGMDKTSQMSKVLTTNECGLKLLIVDDSKLNRKMLRRLLEAQGHVCEEADDGQIAVNMVNVKLHQQSIDREIGFIYDAILMDFVMPIMNGPTATMEIRKLGYKNPIIGVTGNALEKDKEIFMTAGASHVFIKPLDASLITKALQGKQFKKYIFQNLLR